MIYYPIIIPTLCRDVHFKRCVDSLSRNTHANETELVIGLDYPINENHWSGYREIADYIPTIKGFKKVTVFWHEKNIGAGRNDEKLKEYVFEHYDACIYSEDDNEFSPCFLDFMNKALNKYKNEDFITSIAGYNPALFYKAVESNIYSTPSSTAWGLGIWRNKEAKFSEKTKALEKYRKILRSLSCSHKLYCTSPSAFKLLVMMVSENLLWGDVMRTTENILLDKVQIRPTISMVRNWGWDGTGLHCGTDNSIKEQEILNQSTFELDDIIEFRPTKKVLNLILINDLSTNYIRIIVRKLRIVYEYLLYRFS